MKYFDFFHKAYSLAALAVTILAMLYVWCDSPSCLIVPFFIALGIAIVFIAGVIICYNKSI